MSAVDPELLDQWYKEARAHPSGSPCNGIHDATPDRRIIVLIDALRAVPSDQAARSDDNWEPTKWWRAVGLDGSVWAEASHESEVRERARPGDRIEQLWAARRTEWREAGS